jgi:hypothetical protein
MLNINNYKIMLKWVIEWNETIIKGVFDYKNININLLNIKKLICK